jgi:hypothetical protein
MQRISLDNRFVIPPYTPVAFPYCQGYPTYVYPKKYGDKGVIELQPYVFKHYKPASYRDTWDYNEYDRAAAQLNELNRRRFLMRFQVL